MPMASTGRFRIVPRVGTMVASRASSGRAKEHAPTGASGKAGQYDPVTASEKGISVADATAPPIVQPRHQQQCLDSHHPPYLPSGGADELEQCVFPAPSADGQHQRVDDGEGGERDDQSEQQVVHPGLGVGVGVLGRCDDLCARRPRRSGDRGAARLTAAAVCSGSSPSATSTTDSSGSVRWPSSEAHGRRTSAKPSDFS